MKERFFAHLPSQQIILTECPLVAQFRVKLHSRRQDIGQLLLPELKIRSRDSHLLLRSWEIHHFIPRIMNSLERAVYR